MGCHELHKLYYCKNRSVFNRRVGSSCLPALFENDEARIAANCKVQISTAKEVILQISHNQIMMDLERPTRVSMECFMTHRLDVKSIWERLCTTT